MSTPEFNLIDFNPDESLNDLISAAAAYYDGSYQPEWDLDEIHLETLRAQHINVQPLADYAEFDEPDDDDLQMIVIEEYEGERPVVAQAIEAEPDLDFMMGRFVRGVGMAAVQRDLAQRMRI